MIILHFLPYGGDDEHQTSTHLVLGANRCKRKPWEVCIGLTYWALHWENAKKKKKRVFKLFWEFQRIDPCFMQCIRCNALWSLSARGRSEKSCTQHATRPVICHRTKISYATISKAAEMSNNNNKAAKSWPAVKSRSFWTHPRAVSPQGTGEKPESHSSN